MTRPVQLLGWFIIDTLYGLKDRRSDLREGMRLTLERLRVLVEAEHAATTGQTAAG